MGKHYKFYNRNPKNNRVGDCVCRAISLATGLNYKAVDNLLQLIADAYDCEKLCICCYHNLLEKVLCYERITCHNFETVEDLAKLHPRETMIVRIEGHVTCIIKSNILDTWDCSDKLVDCYWFVI